MKKSLSLLLGLSVLMSASLANADPWDQGRGDRDRGRDRDDRRGGRPLVDSVTDKSEDLLRLLRDRGRSLTPQTLMQIDQLLNQATSLAQVQAPLPPPPAPYPAPPNPYPYPGPLPPPAPNPYPYPPSYNDTCEVLGFGAYNGANWRYRIAANGQVLAATDTVDGLFQKLQTLQSNRICAVRSDVCTLSGFGPYAGAMWNFRLNLRNQPVFSSDQFETVMNFVSRAQQAGVCQIQPAGRCQLLGPGSYAGSTWSNRVAIGNEVVMVSDSLDVAIAKMNQVRSSGFCY